MRQEYETEERKSMVHCWREAEGDEVRFRFLGCVIFLIRFGCVIGNWGFMVYCYWKYFCWDITLGTTIFQAM